MGGYGYAYGYPMMGYEGGSIVQVIFSIFWAIVLIVFLIAALRFVRGKSFGRSHYWHGGNTALEILKERYAKGEIDKKEFEEIKHDLEK